MKHLMLKAYVVSETKLPTTKEELEKLLTDAYNEGYNEGYADGSESSKHYKPRTVD